MSWVSCTLDADAVRDRRHGGHGPPVPADRRVSHRRPAVRPGGHLRGDVDAGRDTRRCTARSPRSPNCRTGRARCPACGSANAGSATRRSVGRCPAWTKVKSNSKHDAQFSQRSACSPVRSVTSSVLVQKHVGHTMVQLPHVRQRLATSSQCGDSRDCTRSCRRSASGICRPIRWAAPLTSALAESISALLGGPVRHRRKHVGAGFAADVDQVVTVRHRRCARSAPGRTRGPPPDRCPSTRRSTARRARCS